MPPTHTDEGLVAAREIRARHPDVGVLVLSQYLDAELRVAARGAPERTGYLLKERVSDIAVLVDALQQDHRRRMRLDPTIVARLVAALARARAARRPHRTRAGRARAHGRRTLERRDRRASRRHDANRRGAHPPDPRQARPRESPTTTAGCSPCSRTSAPNGGHRMAIHKPARLELGYLHQLTLWPALFGEDGVVVFLRGRRDLGNGAGMTSRATEAGQRAANGQQTSEIGFA